MDLGLYRSGKFSPPIGWHKWGVRLSSQGVLGSRDCCEKLLWDRCRLLHRDMFVCPGG